MKTLKQFHIWKEAAWVFIPSRVLILLITYVVVGRFPHDISNLHQMCQTGYTHCMQAVQMVQPHACSLNLFSCLSTWKEWDSGYYIDIILYGYNRPLLTAYFPLWPLLVHVVGAIFGGTYQSYVYAGLALSNLCFYMALVLFFPLVSEDFDPSTAKNALFYLSYAPMSLFFFSLYTESLFLLLCLACFYFLRRGGTGNWWLAGICGCLATLTRATGIVLDVAFLVFFIQRFWPQWREAWNTGMWWKKLPWKTLLPAALPMGLLPAGLIAYMLYLGLTLGDPFIFHKVETLYWGRHSAWPWMGTLDALKLLFTAPPSTDVVKTVQDLIFTYVPIVALIIGWKKLPLAYSIFSAVAILFFLCNPLGPGSALGSEPRYVLVIFPVFILFALWSKNPRRDRIFMAFFLTFFAIQMVLFLMQSWAS